MKAEDFSEMEQDEKIAYFIRHWCVENKLLQPDTAKNLAGNIYICPKITDSDLTTLLARLNKEGNGGVVVVNLPGLPQDLFNYLYQIAALPSVFEGQGTANLALNLGKPFFKLAKVNVNPYPSDLGNALPMPSGDDGQPSMASVLSAQLYDATYSWIQIGTYEFKRGFSGKMPPQLLADLLVRQAKDYKVNGPFRQYFDGITRFYTAAANDKLLQALVFLVTKYNPDASLRLQRQDVAEDDNTPLDKLYTQIENAISRGALTLIPTVFPEGPFADFITAIINGTDFTLGSAASPVEVIFPASRDKITVSGLTDDFLGAPLTARVSFTQNEDGQTIDIAFELTLGNVNLIGVEWFTLNNLTLSATIPGTNERLTGSVATQIDVGGQSLTFNMDFPTSGDGKIVIDGDFTSNPPSLNDLFSLLGG
ncbi:hypothetical protein ABC733_19575 [Mangrovibacter sp. SLW1]